MLRGKWTIFSQKLRNADAVPDEHTHKKKQNKTRNWPKYRRGRKKRNFKKADGWDDRHMIFKTETVRVIFSLQPLWEYCIDDIITEELSPILQSLSHTCTLKRKLKKDYKEAPACEELIFFFFYKTKAFKRRSLSSNIDHLVSIRTSIICLSHLEEKKSHENIFIYRWTFSVSFTIHLFLSPFFLRKRV